MWGIMTLLIGLVSFIALPMISLVSRFKAFSNFFLKLAAFPIKRAAIVVSESDDVYFKHMTFLGLGLQKITVDGDEKVFEDPTDALHHWLGMRFAFADEEHGVLFDPRHAAEGTRKASYDERGEGEYLATEDEWESYGVAKWKPGVFEFPKLKELVKLRNIKHLIEGGERSEFADRVETYYEHSRDPFNEGTGATKFLYPIIAFAVTFGGIWFMSSQFGTPSGPNSSVSFGLLTLLLSLNRPEALKNIDWRRPFAYLGLVALPVLPLAALVVFFGPLFTIVIVVTWFIGFLLLPILTILSQAAKPLSGFLSKLYFKLAFFGYRKPVLKWTPRKYVLEEYDENDYTEDVHWYSLFGHLVGFTFEPGEGSWGAEYEEHSQLESQQPATDGGRTIETNLPNKYVRSDSIGSDTDIYGGFIPKRIRSSKYYINTRIALSRWTGAATGEKSLRKLLEAKEEYGNSNSGLDDGLVFKTTAVSGLLGAIGGLAIFVLPAIL